MLVSTFANCAIAHVSSRSQSFQPSRSESFWAIAAPPLPYSRSTVMMLITTFASQPSPLNRPSDTSRCAANAASKRSLLDPHLRLGGHTRPQQVLGILTLLENNLHGN